MSSATLPPPELEQSLFGSAPFNPVTLADRFDPQPDPYLTAPARWSEEKGHSWLWSKQREVAQAVADNRYVSVPSCHDSGKSFLAADLVAWWLDVHPVGEAFAVTTAPTSAQVEAILWREIGRMHRRAELPGRITLDAKWYMGERGGEELVAYGRKPADYDQAAFQGIHARYVLIVIDEASGVPKSLYDAVDSLATNEHARVLAIGNPDDPASHFAKISGPGSGWHTIHISYTDTPNFTDEEVTEELSELMISRTWVEERKKRWGVTSPLYIAKALGQFPDISDDTLLSPKLIREAQERELPGLERGQFGLDVAREGRDETAAYRNRGGVIRLAHRAHKAGTMQTAGAMVTLLDGITGAIPVQVDAIGVGAGVYDRLVELRHKAHAFGSGERAHNPKRYVNRRAEGWWGFRTQMEEGLIDLPPDGKDDDLIAQLGAIKYEHDSAGRIKIESKLKMKKRGLPSPDRADAAMYSTVKPVQVPRDRDVAPETDSADLTADLMGRAM